MTMTAEERSVKLLGFRSQAEQYNSSQSAEAWDVFPGTKYFTGPTICAPLQGTQGCCSQAPMLGPL